MKPQLRARFVTVMLAVGLGVALLGPISANAATSYGPSGSFGNEGLAGPTKIAVEDATGDVLVVDSGRGLVQVYDSAGPAAVPLAEFGAGELSSPYGIAVDQDSGGIYVADAGNSRIVRYDSDGGSPPTFTLDGTYASPVLGGESGQVGSFASPIAVDPTNGDLLVADTGNHRVSRFTASGAFVSSFDGAGSANGTFQSLQDIAVDDSGSTYVVDATGQLPFGGSSVLARFAADGSPQGTLSPISTPLSVAFDSASGNIVAAGNSHFLETPQLYVFNGGALVTATPYPEATNKSAAVGLAADGGTGRIYGLTTFGALGGRIGVEVFDPLIVPDLILNPPTAVTSTTVHASGTVNPVGHDTHYYFEYTSNGSDWSRTPEESAGSGNTPVPVAADITGLAPNTEFKVRLVGFNEAGSIATTTQAFTTQLAAPAAVTGSAADRSATGATLHGTVNPFGIQARYYFEYGLTTAYGSRVPQSFEAPAGLGRTPRSVSQQISGLVSGATYHYRITARSSVGEAFGLDRTFTAPGPEPSRAFELVSPARKSGSEVDPNFGFRATPSGDAIAFQGKTAIEDLTSGAPLFPRYLASRTAAGWMSVGVDPPLATSTTAAVQLVSTLAVSEDGTQALVVSLRELAPGAIEGDSNVYLRDLGTGAYTTIATAPGFSFNQAAGGIGQSSFLGGTPDFSHVVFSGLYSSFLPGAPPFALYEWSEGQLRVASVGPGGALLDGQTAAIGERELPRVSEDGDRIFFTTGSEAVYVREGGQTVPVSASQKSGADDEAKPARLVGVTRDGHFAFIASQDLTDDSPEGAVGLYRFNVDDGDLQWLTAISGSDSVLQTSANGAYAYFQSRLGLAPGGGVGSNDIYVWHDGVVEYVATLDDSLENTPSAWLASPNGKFFVFASRGRLSDYDNTSGACGGFCSEIYRFDAESSELTCVSCPADGVEATGNAGMGPESLDATERHFPRVVLDSGEVFFDTPESLRAADVNGARDVYAYRNDQPVLVSAGTGAGPSQFADASADGRNIFFTTNERLVGIDTDIQFDLYDARVGGGIDSQNPAAPAEACGPDDCRREPGAIAAQPPVGSETVTGPAGRKAHRFPRCRQARHRGKPVAKKHCSAKQRGHRNGGRAR